MDPDILDGLVGVLGLLIPLVALSIGGMLVLSRTRIGEAIARRISGDTRHPRGMTMRGQCVDRRTSSAS
jgi:hypothetical protein